MTTDTQSAKTMVNVTKNLTKIYIIQNGDISQSRDRMYDYATFISKELKTIFEIPLNESEKIYTNETNECINENYSSEFNDIADIFDDERVSNGVTSIDSESIDNLSKNIVSILREMADQRVLKYVENAAIDCVDYDDFDIFDEQSIDQFCMRLAQRLRDYQYGV